MEYITTTELRTQSPRLINSLKKGYNVSLIYRSRVIGEIKPKQETVKTFSSRRVGKIVNKMNLTPIPQKERKRIYEQRLREKYGKNIS